MAEASFDQLVQEALAQDFSGWDFSWARGRWREQEPSWDYREMVQDRIARIDTLLDMGTGGGEFLSSLPDLPADTYATESYPPNIPIARARLEPLGVRVVAFDDGKALPLPDDAFQLVINRHEYYSPPELHRILKPDGIFLTQQVGALDCVQVNEFLRAPRNKESEDLTLEAEVENLRDAGFQVLRAEEELLDSIFYDIGAVVRFLTIIEWQIPDFDVDKYRERLLEMHEQIEAQGAFFAQAHRIIIEAQKV
jgi:SAM-dependent methyltransferase